MPKPPDTKHPASQGSPLSKVLARLDTWRGYGGKPTTCQGSITSGYAELDAVLQQQGWPSSTVIDIAQKYWGYEWPLLVPLLLRAQEQQHRVALLNPPATPYPMALVKQGIDLDQLFIATPKTASEWVSCWRELRCGEAFLSVFAWTQNLKLNYSELRKCQLLAAEQPGLNFLFRHWHSQAQNSPAGLRLANYWQQGFLVCEIFKQRGLMAPQKIKLAVPPHYLPQMPVCPAKGNKEHKASNLILFKR